MAVTRPCNPHMASKPTSDLMCGKKQSEVRALSKRWKQICNGKPPKSIKKNYKINLVYCNQIKYVTINQVDFLIFFQIPEEKTYCG